MGQINNPPTPASIGAVPISRQIVAGTNMTGGGALSSDVTLNSSGGGGGTIDVQENGSSIVAAADTLNFTGDGVTVTDLGSGAAEIAIAGGGGGAPWWLQPPSAASLSLISGDATNLVITDDSDVGLLVDAGNAVSGDITRMAYRTLTDKTLDFDFKILFPAVISLINSSAAGIIIRDSVSGRLSRFGVNQKASTPVDQENYTSLSAYSAGVNSTSYSRDINWFRVVHTGGNYIFYVSVDGKTWVQQLSVGDTSFLTNRADQIGFGVNYARSTGPKIMGSVPFFSLTGPAV